MLPPISVNAKVMIHNARLVCLYWVLMFAMLATLVGRFIRFRQYETAADSTEGLSVILNAPVLSFEQEAKMKAAYPTASYCKAAVNYTYSYDENWVYDPTGCFDVCADMGIRNRSNCEPSSSLNTMSDGRSSMFITTFRRKTWDINGNYRSEAGFSPLADYTDLQVRISYTHPQEFDVMRHLLASGESLKMSSPGVNLVHESRSLLTVLAKATPDGKDIIVQREVSPVENNKGKVRVQFTTGEILELAGLPPLDEIRTDTHQGTKDGAEYPTGRLVGAVIYTTVFCANTPYDLPVDAEVWFDSSKHSGVCVVFFESDRLVWGWRTYVDIVSPQGENVAVYDGGIEVRIRMKAVYRQLDMGHVMVQLSSIIVLMSFPKLLMILLMTKCLGRLSTIFTRAFMKPFQVEVELTAMATRAMSYTYSLKALGGGAESVPVKEIQDHLYQILQGRSEELSPTEMRGLVDFIVQSINYQAQRSMREAEGKCASQKLQSVYKNFAHGISRATSMPVDGPGKYVVLDHLAAVATSGEHVDFLTMVKLFDVDVRHGILERIFLPPNLSKALDSSRRTLVRAKTLDAQAMRAADVQRIDVDLPVDVSGLSPSSAGVSSFGNMAMSCRPSNKRVVSFGFQEPGDFFGLKEITEIVEGLVDKVKRLEAEVAKQARREVGRSRSEESADVTIVCTGDDDAQTPAAETADNCSLRHDVLAEGLRLLELRVSQLEKAPPAQAPAQAQARAQQAVNGIVGDANVGHHVAPQDPPIVEREKDKDKDKEAPMPAPTPPTLAPSQTPTLAPIPAPTQAQAAAAPAPVLAAWRTDASLPDPRQQLGAATVGGAVYVCGGFGGSGVPLGCVTRFKKDAGAGGASSWTSLAPLPTPRQGLAVAAVAGRLYACGGYSSSVGGVLSKVERLDLGAGTWTTVASMTCRRGWPGVAMVEGGLVACGGDAGGPIVNSAERYDAEADAWRPVAAMASARSQLGATCIDGLGLSGVLACGGFGPRGGGGASDRPLGALGAVELYVPRADAWRPLPPLPTPRWGLGVAAVRGTVFACGGRDDSGNVLRVVERLDVGAGAWEAATDMTIARAYFGVAALADRLYIFGGSDGHMRLSDVERLGPA